MTSTAGQLFLDKVVLLSSAVADADNQVMMHGRKLELLSGIDQLLPQLTKTDVTQAQKKVEDLSLRILFQNCPHALIRLIVNVLSQLYNRGSNSSMHACVAYLLQLSVYSPKESIKLDRPIPGLDEEETAARSLSIHEKSVCLSVAVGIIVNRGPSASYFVPNVLGSVLKHTKLIEPAAREAALRHLASVMAVIGVPGTTLGGDIWKNILYRCVYTDNSPQVRIAGARALAVFVEKSKPVVLSNVETMGSICLKVLLSPADHLREQGFMGSLLVEARDAHVEVLVKLLQGSVAVGGERKEAALHTNIKSVKDFSSAIGYVLGLIKKYRGYPHAIEGLSTVLIRLVLSMGGKEDDLFFLGKIFLHDPCISLSVASRCIARILRALPNDSSVLRFVSENIMTVIRDPNYMLNGQQPVCVCLSALVETMSIVEGSIVALDSDLCSDLVQLVSATSFTAVAVNAAYTLRSLCRVCPSQSFSLVNILLNHITVQHAELLGSNNQIYLRSILHYCIALSSVMCECAAQLPQDIASGIFSTATALIEPDNEESENPSSLPSPATSQKRSCGFILLIPILACKPDAMIGRIVPLLSIWKTVLGRKAKDSLSKQISPGSVINDMTAILEAFNCIGLSMRVLVHFLTHLKTSLESQPDTVKMILSFLNNVWQICQLAVPLEQSTANTNPHVTVLVNTIRAELYKALLELDVNDIDSMVKPLVAYLSSEISRDQGGKFHSSVFFDSIVSSTGFVLGSIVDATDSIVEEMGAHEYLLGQAVVQGLTILCPKKSVTDFPILPMKDFFQSSVSCGSLEEYFNLFPSSPGSPFCPLVPYLDIQSPLAPMSSQMTHPVFEQKLCSVELLSKLLAYVDTSLFDACMHVMQASYKALDHVSSTEYENRKSGKDASSIESQTAKACFSSQLTVAVIVGAFYKVFTNAPYMSSLNDSSASSILTLAASPMGLGSLHPFVRRVNSLLISVIYASKPSLQDVIFQCITDSTVSTTARTRAGTASLIGFIVEHQPSAINTFATNLFKISRELSLPIRACCLYAIQSACVAAQTFMAPWSREVLKVTMAHAVADVYPSDLASLLLSGIISGIWPVSSMSQQESAKCDVLWGALRYSPMDLSNKSIARGVERYCVSFASQAGMHNQHVEYVISEIRKSADSSSAVCRDALVGLAEIAEQRVLSKDSLIQDLYSSLFEVSDVNPQLRKQVNQLLKVLLRVHGIHALPIILRSLGGPSTQGEVSPTSTEFNNREDDIDEDEYGSEEEDSERGPKKTGSIRLGASRVVSLSTKALMLKCLKRIFKSDSFLKEASVSCLDKVINIAVSSVSGGTDSNQELAIQGIKLLVLLIHLYSDSIDPKSVQRRPRAYTDDDSLSPASVVDEGGPLPLLLQYETQILTAVRKGVRMNSDASTLVQKHCLLALGVMIEKQLTVSVDKLIELLIQPLVIIDPSTMPWSSYFVIREAGNTVVSGRTILAQTNEKDIALILWTRLKVIIETIEILKDTEHIEIFRANGLFIHYFLIRMLIDCAIAENISPKTTQQNLFSLLPCDIESMAPLIRSLLIPTVLNGLAYTTKIMNWGHLEPTMDCPLSQELDMKALYVGVAMEAALGQYIGVGDLARPCEMIAFDLGYPGILTVYSQTLENEGRLHDYRLIELSHNLISRHEEFALKNKPIVWRIVQDGLVRHDSSETSCTKMCEVIQWLINNEEISGELVTEGLIHLVQKHPLIVVKMLRELSVSKMDILARLIDAVDDLFYQVDGNSIHYVAVLLIPLFTIFVQLVSQDGLENTEALKRLRTSIVFAAKSSLTVATQTMAKLMAVSDCPLIVISEFFFPVIVELISMDTACLSLLLALIGQMAHHKDSIEWTKIVNLVVNMASIVTQDKEEEVAKSVVMCMQPVAVFKDCLGLLSAENKTKVEVLVRKYLPKKPSEEQKSEESNDGEKISTVTSGQAPQIQLKLKFGK